jgi:hypothetical protein
MAMDPAVKTIAAVQGASSAIVRNIFHALVARWQSSARIAGVLEESHGQDNQVCGAGYLRSIASGVRYSMFQDLGPGATGCRIDPAGVLLAGEAVLRDIAAGCDLVLLNRFAKLEAERQGLMSAFAAAVEAGVPLLRYRRHFRGPGSGSLRRSSSCFRQSRRRSTDGGGQSVRAL